jgi:DNA gyrase subunit A
VLDEGDELGWARLTNGEDEIILISEQGQALRFPEARVRSMGRTAGGVTGIGLAKGDLVASMEVIEPEGDLLVISSRGYGKRTPLSDYPVKGRATGGVITIDQKTQKTIGLIVAARVVQEADDLTIISGGGVILRTHVKDLKRAGRATRGVLLMSLEGNDAVVSLGRIAAADLRRVGAETG